MTRVRDALPIGICEACGRLEVSGSYCTYCFADPFTGIIAPTELDIYAVRHALLALHGWKSDRLCWEITRGRPRLIDHATRAGFASWGWLSPTGY